MRAGEARALDIAFLSSWTLAPEQGTGTAVGIRGLARGLEALGHRVHWVEKPGRRSPILRRLFDNLLLPLRLKADRYDLVVGFDVDGCFLPRTVHSDYVVALKGVAADERGHEAGWTRYLFTLLARLEKRNVQKARRVLVTSQHSRRVALRAYGLPPERLAVVPEGIDLAWWEARLGSAVPRTDLRPTILSVARQYRRKNTRTLIGAVPEVRAAYPRVQLRIVGGGPELPALRAQVRELGLGDQVALLGEIDSKSLVREYLHADLFCLPSLQEGFGIVLLEAMAAGLPIVASTAGAIPEVAPHGEVALLVPPTDGHALAAALLHLLGDPELRRTLGARGRARVGRYDWPVVARQFLAVARGGCHSDLAARTELGVGKRTHPLDGGRNS